MEAVSFLETSVKLHHSTLLGIILLFSVCIHQLENKDFVLCNYLQIMVLMYLFEHMLTYVKGVDAMSCSRILTEGVGYIDVHSKKVDL
jgi:hypothetical protein